MVKLRMPAAEAQEVAADFEARTDATSPSPLASPASRDPDDDWILATAVAANAEFLITGDKDLLILGSHASIPIVTPRQFIERTGLAI